MQEIAKANRDGFTTRNTTVKLCVSLDALTDIISGHFTWLSQGLQSALPLSLEEYDAYCKSMVACKINLVAKRRSASFDYREAVVPAFLENFISRIGDRRYDDTGITITWSPVDYQPLADQELHKIALRLAAIRGINSDITNDGCDMRIVTGLDNGYIVDGDTVYSLGGTDVKGYQLAAALDVKPESEVHAMLFRRGMCSVQFAQMEVLRAFN